AFWTAVLQADVPALPRDHIEGSNTVADARQLMVALDEEQTATLLHRVHSAYQTQTPEVLLAALAETWRGWTGSRSLRVALEGHGREEVLAPELDITRTVGWFTSVYPLLLTLPAEPGPGSVLKAIKEQVRHVPQHGVGYGLLREGTDALPPEPPSELGFNYLGQVDQTLGAAGDWRPCPGPRGPSEDRRAARAHLLDLTAQVVGGRLLVGFTYSAAVHDEATVRRLADSYLAALRDLIAHCLAPDAGGFTPSDFPLARLDQAALDRLCLRLPQPADVYPLSPMQQGMLFHTLYDPSSYVSQMVSTLRGPLDHAAWRTAWAQVSARHSVFRTAFVWEQQAEPLQVVVREAELPWTVEDWRDRSPAEQERAFALFLQNDRTRGFALENAPLMRLALFRLGDQTTRFVWTQHHLLLDGWSLPLVLNEVQALYQALLTRQAVTLPPPQPFRAYIAWLARQDLARAEQFWRAQLAGFSAPTPLGGARPEGHRRAAGGNGHQEIALGVEFTTAMQGFAQRHGLTLNTLVQGAWALLLGRYSGEDDVLFGATVAGRPSDLPGVEETVGLFINTLPVRAQLPAHQPLTEWLQALQHQQAELRQYEYTPLVQLQTWSEVPPGQPLFESIVIFENYPVRPSEGADGLPALVMDDLYSVEQSNYPLNIGAVPGPSFRLLASYSEDRFDAAAVARLLEHLRTLLAGMLAQPHAPLHSLPLLTAEEQTALAGWSESGPALPWRGSLPERLRAIAAQTPEATALRDAKGARSFATLLAQAQHLAAHLAARAPEPERPVAVLLERTGNLPAASLAVWLAGRTLLPLDPTLPPARIALLLDDAQPALLLVSAELL
ncbi:MAG TPA: condensation domain-containing protein, partial [Roseiflexaceae bacterium]|nr:condensation domain-containing protein [Roseiflexaceae bacterium]